ncbi:basic blue protein-like [Durio zibethinus]|uniref:Basic blue protein-like n=1 Tax=Durio zibethinus TaxID=66656 RepID=A0A6P5WVH4_DURZI|nr:basic blue protein-like [Durio zibethinus]
MAVHRSLVVFAIVAVIAPAISFAMEFIVGDNDGWKEGVNYQDWAKGKQFIVGDTLVFKYKAGAHNVYKVNGTDFQNCNVPSNHSLGSFSGNDTIKLAAAGNKWYICGVSGHCVAGQKLNITVLASAPASSTAPASSAAPTLLAKEGISQIFLGITFAIVAMVMVN